MFLKERRQKIQMKKKCEMGEEATAPHQHRTRYQVPGTTVQISFGSFQESFEEAKQKQQNFTKKEKRTNP